MQQFVQWIQNKVEIETFLDRSLSQTKRESLIRQVENLEGISNVSYISEEQAARILQKEGFGEDIFNVLDHNPLPASLKIKINNSFKTTQELKRISGQLQMLEGIDEVVYQKKILLILDRYIKIGTIVAVIIGVIIGLSSIFLVSNTIKLSIYARRKILRTMQLVGATNRFIRVPFYFMGFFQGVFGGLIANGLIFGILYFFRIYISNAIWMDNRVFLLIGISGICLGWIGSFFSIRRFLKFEEF